MTYRSWVRPWMIWVVGYPCALIDRAIDAHEYALADVAHFLSEWRKQNGTKEQG